MLESGHRGRPSLLIIVGPLELRGRSMPGQPFTAIATHREAKWMTRRHYSSPCMCVPAQRVREPSHPAADGRRRPTSSLVPLRTGHDTSGARGSSPVDTGKLRAVGMHACHGHEQRQPHLALRCSRVLNPPPVKRRTPLRDKATRRFTRAAGPLPMRSIGRAQPVPQPQRGWGRPHGGGGRAFFLGGRCAAQACALTS